MIFDITSFRYYKETERLEILIEDQWEEVKQITLWKNLQDLAMDHNEEKNTIEVKFRNKPVSPGCTRHLTDADIGQFVIKDDICVIVGLSLTARRMVESIIRDQGDLRALMRWDNI